MRRVFTKKFPPTLETGMHVPYIERIILLAWTYRLPYWRFTWETLHERLL